MRVLYVNPFAQLISGADESLLDLITALVPLGVEPHVLLAAGSPLVARYEAAGARVHEARLSALKRSANPAVVARYGFQLALGATAALRVARRIKPDIVHTNMETVLDGAVAARLLGIPHVLHYRGNTRDEPRVVFDVLTRLWTGLSDRVICISEQTAAIFTKRGFNETVEAMYDPVPIERYRQAARLATVRDELGAGADDLLVGTVARIHPRKDLLTFVEACSRVAAHLPRSRFVIVGGAHDETETTYEAQVRRRAIERGLADRMTFAGSRFDMPSIMSALDIFVLCSRHEGFGRVVAEAMASGVPCVLSNEGALVELSLHGRAALLAMPGNPDAFASAIVAVAGDDELRQSLIREGSRRVDAFRPTLVAAAILQRYRSVLIGRGNSG